MDFPDDNSSEATAHTAVIAGKLQESIDHLRKDVGTIDDLRAKALFETSAEVLGGLYTAFIHYDEGTEEAWRR